jgi:hypothetical protein
MSDEIIAGRVGPHRESHEPRLLAHNFLADGITPTEGFLEWDGTAGVGEKWGMDGNDIWGDCGAAMTDHGNIAKENNPHAVGTLGRPQFDGTLGTYWAYGIAQGEVGKPPNRPDQPDDGVDNASWFAFLYKLGIIKGYGEVQDNFFDWFAQTFKGGCVGQALDGPVASNDFNAVPKIPWDTMGMTDGHDTLTIITHADGSGACVTWARVQPYTAAYRRTNWQDRWVFFDKDDPNVNWPKLQAALDEIHGVVSAETIAAAKDDLLQKIERVLKDVEHISDTAVHDVEHEIDLAEHDVERSVTDAHVAVDGLNIDQHVKDAIKAIIEFAAKQSNQHAASNLIGIVMQIVRTISLLGL